MLAIEDRLELRPLARPITACLGVIYVVNERGGKAGRILTVSLGYIGQCIAEYFKMCFGILLLHGEGDGFRRSYGSKMRPHF